MFPRNLFLRLCPISFYVLRSQPADGLATQSRSQTAKVNRNTRWFEMRVNNEYRRASCRKSRLGNWESNLFFTEGHKTQNGSSYSTSPLTAGAYLICSSKALSKIWRSRLLCLPKVPRVCVYSMFVYNGGRLIRVFSKANTDIYRAGWPMTGVISVLLSIKSKITQKSL